MGRPVSAAEAGSVETYQPRQSRAWWLKNPRYTLYMLREFSSIPIAAWMVWLLVEIARVRSGPAGYHPHLSTGFIVVSFICLLFALLHSATFLSYSGLIMRIPLGSRNVPAALVSGASFGLFLAASALLVFLIIWFGR